ncbi:MAG: putative nicotinate-nucleotide adenylyltransferase [Phycisphaerales bacterium]|nr:putative nicotinate-nucleotide adenylyltransferase [Phycisphaerales bacterium]
MTPITPLPAATDSHAFILVGGTFDPPHRAHVELAVHARGIAGLGGALLVFVPAARSPLKTGNAAGASAAHRAAMVRLAVCDVPGAVVWTDEIDRAAGDDPSYWVDTLRRFRSLVPAGSDVRFIIGTDQAAAFHRWREPREILALARPIVLPRAPIASRQDLAEALRATGAWTEEEIAVWERAMIDAPLDPVSSTALRREMRASAGPAVPAPVEPRVARYIREHDLYRS